MLLVQLTLFPPLGVQQLTDIVEIFPTKFCLHEKAVPPTPHKTYPINDLYLILHFKTRIFFLVTDVYCLLRYWYLLPTFQAFWLSYVAVQVVL